MTFVAPQAGRVLLFFFETVDGANRGTVPTSGESALSAGAAEMVSSPGQRCCPRGVVPAGMVSFWGGKAVPEGWLPAGIVPLWVRH